jgi:hypothetical protein
MYSFADKGMAQDLRKTQELPQKVSDGKRSLSIIQYVQISQWGLGTE